MNPLLIVTYLLNMILISSVFGSWGLVIALALSFGAYYFIAKDGGPKRMHWGQVVAIALGHFIGVIAVAKAPWGTPTLLGVAIIMELFVVFIFVGLGRR